MHSFPLFNYPLLQANMKMELIDVSHFKIIFFHFAFNMWYHLTWMIRSAKKNTEYQHNFVTIHI